MHTRVKLAAIFAFSIFALTFVVPTATMQTQQELTAGEKFKNIKVLNGIPADHLGKVMNIMTVSLGVDCNYCHVSNDEDFEKDGKKEKETTREMLKMTLELNKQYFEGKTEVTCATCHAGRQHPVSLPGLTPVSDAPRPNQPETKPTHFELIDKFENAIGGRDKIDRIKSRRIKAQRIEPDGTEEIETVLQKPGKILIETRYPGFVVTEGFDGTLAWKKSNDFVIALKPDEAEQIQREAQLFYGDLRTTYEKIDVRMLDSVDGKEAFLVDAITANKTRERLYFDVSSGYLIRRSTGFPTVIGFFVYQVDYSDYKNFGGVYLPSTVKYSMPGISWTRKILEVENNIEIADSEFSLNAD